MRVYLDCCCIQRPFDDQKQPRIKLETEAFLAVLAAAEAGVLSILGSDALLLELEAIPEPRRRDEGVAILTLANEWLTLSPAVERSARAISLVGVEPMDALHLAFASGAAVDYFVTCDDKLLKKAQALESLSCRPISLLSLVAEVIE